MKVESTRVILSVTPKDSVLQITFERETWTLERLTHRPVKFGCEVKQVPSGERIGRGLRMWRQGRGQVAGSGP